MGGGEGLDEAVSSAPRTPATVTAESHAGDTLVRPRVPPGSLLGLGGVVDQGGEEPGEVLRGWDDARAEEGLVP